MEKDDKIEQSAERKADYEKRGYLLEDFRLFHLKDANGTEMEYHYHEFCKLVLLISGKGGYTVEGMQYKLEAGDILLIGSRQVHRPEFEKGVPYERIILYIAPEFLERYSADECKLEEIFDGRMGHVMNPKERDRKVLFGIAEKLEQELAASERFAKMVMTNSLLLQLLVEIGRRKKKTADRQQEVQQVENPRISELLQYISMHLTEELDIDMLSERIFLSRYHMMRLFKKETGQTIYDYLTEQRLLYARGLMRQGVSATESCFRSGFGSYSSFTRAYGKRFGTTPTGRNGRCIPMDETYEI